jgi:hypothetical protein
MVDDTHARTRLGFRPRVSIEDTIRSVDADRFR